MQKRFVPAVRAGFALLALNAVGQVHAQTNLTGIINSYQPVTAITPTGCYTDVTVGSSASFAVGDSVLLIQMKGAVIDSSNSASFGTVTNLNGAGSYEIKLISAISGNTLSLLGALANSYDVNGAVQVVSFPTYASANVMGTLTASPWNGSIGGVLAFRVWGALGLYSDINTDGLGFRGGTISNNPDGVCGGGSPDYYYDIYQGGLYWVSGGAEKGEGIATISFSKGAGKGALANGGGGGNKHNFGGAGGGNYTRGGKGGGPLQGCPNTGDGGEGGWALATAINAGALFLGGGGGCGDDNNSVGQPGVSGGGIILIVADQIDGNGQTIHSNGLSQILPGYGIADGTGGGGAGGTILLSANSYPSMLTVAANGGDGGDQTPTWGCVGPGGGGGTGAIISCAGAFSPNVVLQTLPGFAGTFNTGGFPCSGTTYDAMDGDPNTAAPVVLAGCFPPAPVVVTLDNDVISDMSLCVGDTIFIDTMTTGASYLWQDGTNDPYWIVTAAGPVTVQTTLGCDVVNDAAMITVPLTPALDYISDVTLCPGDTLFVDPVLPGAILWWQDGSTVPFAVVNDSATFTVHVVLGCDTVSDDALVQVPPLPAIDLGPDTALCPGDRIILSVDAGYASYLWDDGSTSASRLITGAGSYDLVVSDACDRSASDSIEVSQRDCSCYLYMPNSFTPDADGMNDAVRPLYDCDFHSYRFMIFDRWGEVIFDTEDPDEAWDGSTGGSPAQIGVYVYKVSYRSVRELENREKSGHITLVR